jgi:hypothetical protein
VRRHCARPGCTTVATTTFTFDARERTVWLDPAVDGGARAGELCDRHARSLTAPAGWTVDDRRGGLRFDVRAATSARLLTEAGNDRHGRAS